MDSAPWMRVSIKCRARSSEDYLIGRIDQNFSSKSNIFGRYIYNAASVDDPNRTITGQITQTRFQYTTIEHAYILSPRLLNRPDSLPIQPPLLAPQLLQFLFSHDEAVICQLKEKPV